MEALSIFASPKKSRHVARIDASFCKPFAHGMAAPEKRERAHQARERGDGGGEAKPKTQNAPILDLN